MSWLCLFSLSQWFGLSVSSYNLSFWSKHMNGHAKTGLRRVPLFFLFTYHPARHFYTLIILRRLSKSHQSLNKLSCLYLEVTDDCRISVLLDKPCKVPDERQHATKVTDTACKTWHHFEQPPKLNIGRDGWMETIQTFPLHVSPGTTDNDQLFGKFRH